jgi:hypothetical protein
MLRAEELETVFAEMGKARPDAAIVQPSLPANGVALVWYHPTSSPVWAIWANLICQALAIVLTAILWGQWQAKLSKDPLGSRSPYLTKILATHWLRTLLINADALILLTWAVQVIE